MTSWPETLDAYERALDHYENTLAGQTTDPEPHWSAVQLPTDQIPPQLAERAAELLERSRRLDECIRIALDARTDRPGTAPRHRYQRREPTVSVLDTSA